jgi:hypothetical protein
MGKLVKIVTSGTGMDKAVRPLVDQKISDVVAVTYTEMLLCKNGLSKYFDENFIDELDPVKNKRVYEFISSIDAVKRESMSKSVSHVPDIDFFKLVLPDSHRDLIHSELKDEDLTGWSKILSDVNKNQSIIKSIIKGLYGLTGIKDNALKTFDVSEIINKEAKVTQFFVATPTNNELNKLADLFRLCLGERTIVRVLSGAEDATNKTAEAIVKDDIERCKDENLERVIVLSKNMGSRSFSIPEIDAVVLMFDNGSVGSMIQKISRALTGGLDFYGNTKTKGNVISLSLDPNRVDNVDLYVVEEAVKNKTKSESMPEMIRKIRKSVNIFEIDANGDPVSLLQKDDYYNELIEKFNFDRLKNTQIDLIPLMENSDLRDLLLDINSSELSKRKDKVKQLKGKGKKYVDGDSGDKEKKNVDIEKVDIETIRLAVMTINKSILSIVGIDDSIGGTKSFRAVLRSIEEDSDKKSEFYELFNINPSVTLRLLDEGVINENLIDFCLSRF